MTILINNQMNDNNINNILYDDNCEHTSRGCKLFTPCCEKYFYCRICHDTEISNTEPDLDKHHKMNGKYVTKIMCKWCDHEQHPQQYCEQCNNCFGKYYCDICHIFDDIKSIFHCDKCGNCRLGKLDDFEHCDVCDCCFPKTSHDKTKCIQNISNNDCPICMEQMHDSSDGFLQMTCGHMIHVKCIEQYIRTNNKCPLCCKTLIFDEFKHAYMKYIYATVPMPQEYVDKKVCIYCNDCGSTNEVTWNCYVQFCPKCDSMNVK